LKGSGKTPFSRSGDGRAVLRSSIREFVASNAMHHLNVPTTKCLSLVISVSEKVNREWYDKSNGKNIIKSNKTAITCRDTPSFLRVGHIELFGRRALSSRNITDRSHRLKELDLMFRYMIFREYPHLSNLNIEDMIDKFLTEYALRLAYMVSQWIRVGYVQSNFNSDGCLVSGRTMDYDPFGFLEKYDPDKNFWSESGQHFSFMNQMNAAKRNYLSFETSIEPLLNEKCIFSIEIRTRLSD
jgi:uncharacterized protein YdiU (UPF0061 family)